jgi:hypothetical protein
VAAVAVGQWCLLLGMSAFAAATASWVSALGNGSLYSLFDCYTSDPFMYMVGPLIAVAVWQGRVGRAGAFGAVGVFAKEFAAAPLWICSAFEALENRRREAVRLAFASTAVTLVWIALQSSLRLLLNYRNGATASADPRDASSGDGGSARAVPRSDARGARVAPPRDSSARSGARTARDRRDGPDRPSEIVGAAGPLGPRGQNRPGALELLELRGDELVRAPDDARADALPC